MPNQVSGQWIATGAFAAMVIQDMIWVGHEVPPNPFHFGGGTFWWKVNQHKQVEVITQDPLVMLAREYDA